MVVCGSVVEYGKNHPSSLGRKVQRRKEDMDNEALVRILEEVGGVDVKCRILETENKTLKCQIEELTQKVLMMKEVMQEKGLLE